LAGQILEEESEPEAAEGGEDAGAEETGSVTPISERSGRRGRRA